MARKCGICQKKRIAKSAHPPGVISPRAASSSPSAAAAHRGWRRPRVFKVVTRLSGGVDEKITAPACQPPSRPVSGFTARARVDQTEARGQFRRKSSTVPGCNRRPERKRAVLGALHFSHRVRVRATGSRQTALAAAYLRGSQHGVQEQKQVERAGIAHVEPDQGREEDEEGEPGLNEVGKHREPGFFHAGDAQGLYGGFQFNNASMARRRGDRLGGREGRWHRLRHRRDRGASGN